jgi:DNA-binding NtrC family response regulator
VTFPISRPSASGSGKLRTLVVEDDADSRDALVEIIESEGFQAIAAASLAEARQLVESDQPELALVDLLVPGAGTTGRCESRLIEPDFDSPEPCEVVEPLDFGRLRTVLLQSAGREQLREELQRLRDRLRGLDHFGPMVGASRAMREIFGQIARVAPTEAAVLVVGESGTGKELVAETVHELSRRSGKPMISVNCGAISATLIESELFGHERGSFTGADRLHRGHFERADGGTLFLDEINEMPNDLQVKLLRVLESGTFTRVGGDRSLRVDVRIVAASKPNLELAVAQGRFRADLLYRLRVFPIDLPPLRERDGDVVLLTRHFLSEMNRTQECAKTLTPAALDRLRVHDWPGNVRELRHLLERAFILSDAEIGAAELVGLPPAHRAVELTANGGGHRLPVEPGMSLAEVERVFVLATLDSVGGNRTRAAEVLRISAKTLYSRLRDYRTSGHWAGPPEKAKREADSRN